MPDVLDSVNEINTTSPDKAVGKTAGKVTGWVIDPVARTIEPAPYVPGDYTSIYPVLSTPERPVDTFTCVDIADRDTVYIDDNGMIQGPVYYFFLLNGFPQPLAGKGFVLGTDEDGNSVAPKISREALVAEVTFLEFLMPIGNALAFTYWPAASPQGSGRGVMLIEGDPQRPIDIDTQRPDPQFPYKTTFGGASGAF